MIQIERHAMMFISNEFGRCKGLTEENLINESMTLQSLSNGQITCNIAPSPILFSHIPACGQEQHATELPRSPTDQLHIQLPHASNF